MSVRPREPGLGLPGPASRAGDLCVQLVAQGGEELWTGLPALLCPLEIPPKFPTAGATFSFVTRLPFTEPVLPRQPPRSTSVHSPWLVWLLTLWVALNWVDLSLPLGV